MGDAATVFVIDDNPAVLQSISALLTSQGLVTECFPSAEGYLQHVDGSRRGCLVLDVRMPGMTGLQLLKHIVAQDAYRPIVMITAYAELEVAVEAMKLGAIDFLLKPFPPVQLVQAVTRALEQDARHRDTWNARTEALRKIDALADEERQILSGIVRGLTNQQMADELDVSLRTVQFRRTAMMKSLGVVTKPELLALVEHAQWAPA